MFKTKSAVVILCLIVLAAPVSARIFSPPENTGFLENILVSQNERGLSVEIHLSRYSSHRFFEMTSPKRLVIDFSDIVNINSQRQIEVMSHGIKTIRAGMFKTDVARVVFDLEEVESSFMLEKITAGLRVRFLQKKNTWEPEQKPAPAPQTKIEPAPVITPPPPPPPPLVEDIKSVEKEITALKSQTDKMQEQLTDTQTKMDEAVTILKQMQEEKARKSKKFVRIEIIANYFTPEEGIFKDTYGSGLMEGAELNFGIWDMLEMWVAIKNFSKRSDPDAAGPESSLRYIPLEGGLKIRFSKGLINPYLGGGIAYHQYKEELSTGEVNEKQIGFLGQAGCFVKIAENLVLDIYAHYRHSRIDIGTQEINGGGLHFGAGLGFEF